jgi:hypothetical protein
MQEKLNFSFFVDLIKDAVGYESGMLKTLIDLLRKPSKILQSLHSGDHTYVKPTKFFLNCSGYFILVNSFFINWVEVGKRHDDDFNKLFETEAETNFSFLLDLLFSKAFIPFTLFLILVQLLIVVQFSKKLQVSSKDHVAIVFYRASLGIFFTFITGLTLAFLPFIYGFPICIVLAAIMMFEPKKFSLVKSADAYLPEYGNELISVYRKSAIMLGLIVAAIVLFYVLVLEKYLVGI